MTDACLLHAVCAALQHCSCVTLTGHMQCSPHTLAPSQTFNTRKDRTHKDKHDDDDQMRWRQWREVIDTRDSDVLTRVRSAVLQSWQIHCQLRSQCSQQCCSAAVHLCSLQSVHFAACSSSNDRYLIRSHLNQPSYDEVKVTPSQTHT